MHVHGADKVAVFVDELVDASSVGVAPAVFVWLFGADVRFDKGVPVFAVGVGTVEEVATGAFGGAFALLQLDLRLPAFAAEPAKFFGARQRQRRARLKALLWLRNTFHRVAVAIAWHASTAHGVGSIW
ncbi:MAG: hypothetical protein CMM02_05970 [Rhodopirellula sp.]|nr:hypothetical protein [Rhodopirellula sp.]